MTRRRESSTEPTASKGKRGTSSTAILSRRDACASRGETNDRAQVVPFNPADERFIDYLIDEAVRAWRAANS
jgi:hypothetical protein